MKTSVENYAKVEKSGEMNENILCTNLNKLELFSPKNSSLTEPLIEIKDILNDAYLKVVKYYTELEQKCVSLEAAFQQLKNTNPRSQCNKTEADDAFFNKILLGDGVSISPQTPRSDKMDDISSCIKSLTPNKPQEANEDQNGLVKTPSPKESDYHTSPVVQKQSRSGKRKALRLSSRKRSRITNDDVKVSPTSGEFSELTSMDRTLVEEKSKTDMRDCFTPLAEESDDSFIIEPSPKPVSKNQRRINSIFGDKKLSDIACVNNEDVSTPASVNILANCKISPTKVIDTKNDINGNVKNQKTKWNLKKSRDINGNKKLKQTLLSTAFLTKPVDITESNDFKGGVASVSNTSKSTEPEDMELTSINKSFTNRPNDEESKLNDSITRFQETDFYNTQSQKDKENALHKPSTPPKEAIFNTDHLKREIETKPLARQFGTIIQELDKENKAIIEPSTDFEETFFNPMVTSTHQEVETKEKPFPKIIAPVAKNSFDYIPSPESEPKYKYRRDAVRKKSERRKLDGWECAMCYKFYLEGRQQFGDTQIKNIIKKCSRHRDRYPLNANTPPGLWNPKFDETDDESD